DFYCMSWHNKAGLF
nr:immunoglobulin light chain junction region [Macaca mulatta]